MTTNDIGKIQRTFKPGLDNLVAGVIIGLLMIAGGSTFGYFVIKGVIESRGQLPFVVEKGWSWSAALLGAVVSAGLIYGGVLFIQWMQSLSSLRVQVGDDGFSVFQKNEKQVFKWSQIASVTETHLYERPPLLKGPAKLILPKAKSRSFLVRRNDDEEFAFDGNTLRKHDEFAYIIKAHLEGREIPWEVVEKHA